MRVLITNENLKYKQRSIPFVCRQEDLRKPFSAQLMLLMNVEVEASQKMVHQIDKKQLAYQVVYEFLQRPVMPWNMYQTNTKIGKSRII